MRKIARIVLPISLEKEFDYSFGADSALEKGMRVLVDFRGKKRVGVVVAIEQKSKLKKLKTILSVLDHKPLLTEEKLVFAKRLTGLYPYALGEFIFMMIPASLKKPRRWKLSDSVAAGTDKSSRRRLFIKSPDFLKRYQLWRKLVQKELAQGSVMVCFPQVSYLVKARQMMLKDFPWQIKVLHSQRKEAEFFSSWQESRNNSLILGTRMALFHYPSDLRLLIVEEEDSPYYFQAEKPFYDLREVAGLLSDIKNIDLVLAAGLPSLTTYKQINDKKIELEELNSESSETKVVETGSFSKKKVVGPVLIELLGKVVKKNQQAVVLWNRKGFAQVLRCSACGYIYKCRHCSGFLQVSRLKQKTRCPYCLREVDLPTFCSQCHKGYLKSFGLGVEGLIQRLKTAFPEIKIANWPKRSRDSKIIVSTSEILSSLYDQEIFESGFLLDTDSLLSRPDYQATFDAFLYINKLNTFFKEGLYLFTVNRDYYLFDYLNKDWRQFYEQELSLRKKMDLPPFRLLAKITLRAKNEKLLLKGAEDLYNSLKGSFSEVYGPSQEYPFKLRDKFRYAITVKTDRSLKKRKIIKERLDQFRSSNLQLAVELH